MLCRKGAVGLVLVCALALMFAAGCGKKGPKTKSMDEMLTFLKENGVPVGSKAEKDYSPNFSVKGYIVEVGLGSICLYKFSLGNERHVAELERLKKTREIEVSFHAPGLTEPVWVNGPFVLHGLPGVGAAREVSEVFMRFDPFVKEKGAEDGKE